MHSPCLIVICSILFLLSSVRADCSNSGYVGYNLSVSGDPNSTTYETDCTDVGDSSTYPEPDVYLNASVHVSEIDITVTNLTAKINVEAQVLSLLDFNAGVSVSIDEVELLIEDVDAKVLLEARLGNVVAMIDDVLDSLDLNPILATLGDDITSITNSTVSDLTGSTSSTNAKRSYDLATNTLFSVNNYEGNTHRNRILAQNGNIVDQYLDNSGHIYSQVIVGTYSDDMTFNGYNQTVIYDGQVVQELQYDYLPFHGLKIVSTIFLGDNGNVVATEVLSESGAQGTSTIGGS